MKRDKVIYWIATILISAMMLLSSFMYLSKSPMLMASIKVLGIPYYFMALLGVAKLLGVIALLTPTKWYLLKEWAYAGFTFTFIGAIWTHSVTGTSFVPPIFALVLLAISYWAWHRINKEAVAI